MFLGNFKTPPFLTDMKEGRDEEKEKNLPELRESLAAVVSNRLLLSLPLSSAARPTCTSAVWGGLGHILRRVSPANRWPGWLLVLGSRVSS